jgi:hypothetical protein
MRKTSMLMCVMLVTLVGFGGVRASAQSGYYPIEEMGIFAPGDLKVDVDLSGAMLQVAAGAMENEDESLAELVTNLERVRVQVGLPSAVEGSAVARTFADAYASLEGAGWNKILAVEESTEQIYLYSLESEGNIVGLTAFVNDLAEGVVAVNIVGKIDPRTLGRLIATIEDFDLDGLMAATGQEE